MNSTKRNKKLSHFNVKAIIPSRVYHEYKEKAWSGAKVNYKVKVDIKTNQSSFAIDTCACAVKTKHKYYEDWRTVGHLPRIIWKYIYFFIKKEGGTISNNVKSLNYKPSPVPSESLEVPLQLIFSCSKKQVWNKIKDFINNLYNMISLGSFTMMTVQIKMILKLI